MVNKNADPAAHELARKTRAAAKKAAELEQAAEARRARREMRRQVRRARMALIAETVAAGWGFMLRDVGGLAGVGLVSYGAWDAYHPAGFIVGGALLLAGAWIAAAKDNG